MVEKEILNIEKFRENTYVDEFIVMPNYIHIIVFLFGNNENNNFSNKGTIGNVIKLFKGFYQKKLKN